MIENDPISFLLRKILVDPASTKLLTTIISTVLIINIAGNVRADWNKIPLIVIFCSSLIYSIFSILVVIFKKQETVANCAVLKNVFRGRKIYWHEIQTTAAFTLAFANISGLALCGKSYESGTQVIFSILNTALFLFEWYFAAENGKNFVSEENPKMGHSFLECIFGVFRGFPLFFNIFRKACFIASLILVVTNYSLEYTSTYYIYCISFAIVASFLLFTLQTSGALENGISTKLVSGRKWHTYLMLIVAIHAFLAVLTLSLIVHTTSEQYREFDNSITNAYNNYYNNGYYNNNNRNNFYGSRYVTPKWVTRYTTYYGPLASPVAFGLSCVALVLSIFDLYSRAIYSRSRQDNDITAPLNVTGGVNKIEDFPVIIASPRIFDSVNKQIYI
jgi:hypothetical protein